jgi:CubicO group peptidase (beta-lactamase class C family)
MSELKIRVDPESMGFDPARLQSIQTHFDAYVADGRLPGWLATVSRGDELVWVGKSGFRNREENLEVTDDTIWRIYSMTKPIVSIAAMMLFEEGAFDLNDDVGQWIEEPSRTASFCRGHCRRARDGARAGTGTSAASSDSDERPHVRNSAITTPWTRCIATWDTNSASPRTLI